MVKPDPRKNYYADLDLAADASIDDIRRNYRKLALKFHPDRNAGHEDEVVPKFQAIQAAFEVLSDDSQRNKYDAERRRSAAFPSAGNGNPMPPRPPPRAAAESFNGVFPGKTRTRPHSQFYNGGPARGDFGGGLGGMNGGRGGPGGPAAGPGRGGPTMAGPRFTDFRPPAAGGPRDIPTADRANMNFSAWQNLNPNPKGPNAKPPRPAPTAPKPPPPSSWDGAGLRSDWPPQRDSPQRPGAPPGVRRANTTNTRPAPKAAGKPFGFDPQAPHDEPRAAGPSAYAHYNSPPESGPFGRPKVHRHAATDSYHPPPPTSRGRGPSMDSSAAPPFVSPKMQDRTEDVPFYEGAPRPRMAYPSAAGERTFFSSEGFGRSASTRTSPQRPHSGHHHSAESLRPHPPRHRSLSPTPARKVHTADDHHPPRTAPAHGQPPQQPSAVPYSESSDDDDDVASDSDEVDIKDFGLRKGQNKTKVSPSARKKATPSSRLKNGRRASLRPSHSDDNNVGRKASTASSATEGTGRQGSVFSFTVDDTTFAPTGTQQQSERKSRSDEQINAKYSPSDFHGAFEGSPAPTTASTNSRPSTRASQSRRGRRNSRSSPAKQAAANGAMPPPPPPPPPTNGATQAEDAVPGKVELRPEEWQKIFKDPSWAYHTQSSPTREGSVSAAATARSKGTTSRHGSASGSKAKPATVQDASATSSPDVDGQEATRVDSGAAGVSNSKDTDADGDAMEIDTPPHPSTQTPISPTSTTKFSDVLLPPPPPPPPPGPPPTSARVNGLPAQQQQQQQPPPRMVAVPPSLHTRDHHHGHGNRAPPPNAIHTDLNDLLKTTPFISPPSTGLSSAADLKSALPFASAPNHAQHPKRTPSVSHKTDEDCSAAAAVAKKIGDPPRVPAIPNWTTQLVQRTEWDAVSVAMANYMRGWSTWSSHMMLYFHHRQSELDDIGTGTSGFLGWLTATGEAANADGQGASVGFDTYSGSLREQEVLRMKWTVATERHMDAVAAYGRCREHVRNRGVVG